MSDFRNIISKFDSKCTETGKPIKVGDRCLYNIQTKRVFSMESEIAKKEMEEFKSSKELPF